MHYDGRIALANAVYAFVNTADISAHISIIWNHYNLFHMT